MPPGQTHDESNMSTWQGAVEEIICKCMVTDSGQFLVIVSVAENSFCGMFGLVKSPSPPGSLDLPLLPLQPPLDNVHMAYIWIADYFLLHALHTTWYMWLRVYKINENVGSTKSSQAMARMACMDGSAALNDNKLYVHTEHIYSNRPFGIMIVVSWPTSKGICWWSARPYWLVGNLPTDVVIIPQMAARL